MIKVAFKVIGLKGYRFRKLTTEQLAQCKRKGARYNSLRGCWYINRTRFAEVDNLLAEGAQ